MKFTHGGCRNGAGRKGRQEDAFSWRLRLTAFQIDALRDLAAELKCSQGDAVGWLLSQNFLKPQPLPEPQLGAKHTVDLCAGEKRPNKQALTIRLYESVLDDLRVRGDRAHLTTAQVAASLIIQGLYHGAFTGLRRAEQNRCE